MYLIWINNLPRTKAQNVVPPCKIPRFRRRAAEKTPIQIQNFSTWDDGNPWDDNEIGFDEYRIVPGYDDNQLDPEVNNERAGIWRIDQNENDILRLTFVQSVSLQQRILVKFGNLYGGKIVRYGPIIRFDVGETVPSYSVIAEITRGNETIFDGGSTRFVESISIYQNPDEGDKYLAFPRVNIFA